MEYFLIVRPPFDLAALVHIERVHNLLDLHRLQENEL